MRIHYSEPLKKMFIQFLVKIGFTHVYILLIIALLVHQKNQDIKTNNHITSL